MWLAFRDTDNFHRFPVDEGLTILVFVKIGITSDMLVSIKKIWKLQMRNVNIQVGVYLLK